MRHCWASKVILDLDNCLKVALDALQGVIIENDNQIKEIHEASDVELEFFQNASDALELIEELIEEEEEYLEEEELEEIEETEETEEEELSEEI
ncbi:MAG: Endodeoxyribonuclease RusA, partial [Actinomycetota bacterium]